MGIVSFKPVGRLGNFLIEAFTCVSYALKYDLAYSMPLETKDKFWNPIYYQNLQHPLWDGKVDVHVQELMFFRYDELQFNPAWRGKKILLDGYFQNIQYFKEYREQLLDLFGLRLSYNGGLVSVHCRRGDYLSIPDKHIVPNKEWYERAMAMFHDKIFVWCSDEIAWCKENFGHREDCIFIEGGNEMSDLQRIINCGHHINSSSTFSWIGAWCSSNPNKKVITPDKWMTPRASNQWTEELILPEWTKLAV